MHIVCKDISPSGPNFQELYNKVDGLRRGQNKQLKILDRMADDERKALRKLDFIEDQNRDLSSELFKLDTDIQKKHRMILSQMNFLNSSNAEIKDRLEELRESDEELKTKIDALGENDEEIIEKLKEIANTENTIIEKQDKLHENLKEVRELENAILKNQTIMFEVINKFSDSVKDQFKNLSLGQQDMIKRQVQLALMQNMTAAKLTDVSEELKQVNLKIMNEVVKTQYITMYNPYLNQILKASQQYSYMNTYSFNIIKMDSESKRFLTDAKDLEFAIHEVLAMFGGDIWHGKKTIFKNLKEACSVSFFQNIIRIVKHGIDLVYVRGRMKGNPLR